MKKLVLMFGLIFGATVTVAHAQQVQNNVIICDYLAAITSNHGADGIHADWINVLSVSDQNVYTGFISAENQALVQDKAGVYKISFTQDQKSLELLIGKNFYILTEESNGQKTSVKRECRINNLDY